MTRASQGSLAPWLTSHSDLVFQLHVVHYNSDRYKSFAEAKDKPDGLAVLAFFYEVRGKTSHVFVYPLFKAVLFHFGPPGCVQASAPDGGNVSDIRPWLLLKEVHAEVLGEKILKAFEVTAILLLESASWVQKLLKGSLAWFSTEWILVSRDWFWFSPGKSRHCGNHTVGILCGWSPAGQSSLPTDDSWTSQRIHCCSTDYCYLVTLLLLSYDEDSCFTWLTFLLVIVCFFLWFVMKT